MIGIIMVWFVHACNARLINDHYTKSTRDNIKTCSSLCDFMCFIQSNGSKGAININDFFFSCTMQLNKKMKIGTIYICWTESETRIQTGWIKKSWKTVLIASNFTECSLNALNVPSCWILLHWDPFAPYIFFLFHPKQLCYMDWKTFARYLVSIDIIYGLARYTDTLR